jgi:hypothetical protein
MCEFGEWLHKKHDAKTRRSWSKQHLGTQTWAPKIGSAQSKLGVETARCSELPRSVAMEEAA